MKKSSKERKEARSLDVPMRGRAFTDMVYGGINGGDFSQMNTAVHKKSESGDYHVFIGEMHGHTNLSDAIPDIDTYFTVARDQAKLDFCAISDHDHGGVGRTELWGEKWDLTLHKVKEYNEPGKFVTILAYERDSYPWYNNLVVYYKDDFGDMIRGEKDGDINSQELSMALGRDDVLLVPHTTSYLNSGCDFRKIPLNLMTPLIEVYSRWGTDEYFGNPNPCRIETKGGFWTDALEKGAKMGCIGGSDDHTGTPGIIKSLHGDGNLQYQWPGLTGVICKDLSRESIFEALKARRCFALMGGRIELDFRINGHYMGEEIALPKEDTRVITFNVHSDEDIESISIIKNGTVIIRYNYGRIEPNLRTLTDTLLDYEIQREEDYYYLRLELIDGRKAWSSPIWVQT